MQNRGGIQRLKRGEMSRIDPSKAQHTDVFQPAPAPPYTSESVEQDVGPLLAEIAQQKRQNEDLRTALTDSQGELDAVKRQLTDARSDELKLKEELEAVKTEELKPTQGVEILSVEEVRKKDGLARLDCVTKPTKGPVGDQVSLYIPTDKLLDSLTEPSKKSKGAKKHGNGKR